MNPEPAANALRPSSLLPLAYYTVAHAGFVAALLVLVADPSIPSGSFYQPRVIALVHLVTIAWLTGSILGSLYIVGPLALRVPMPVRARDWVAFGAFVTGASGMVSHFWINTYDGMAWSGALVTIAVLWVGWRVIRGLGPAVSFGVRLHIVLAFVKFLAAALFGMLLGFDRSRGYFSTAQFSMVFAHVHLAAVGWVTMLVIGLAYRLIPMLLPARMPSRASIATSAVLLEIGLVLLAINLLTQTALWLGVLTIVGGIVSFVVHVRRMVSQRLPRPPALPARDWSIWQIHAAFGWLIAAVLCGIWLSVNADNDRRLPLMWTYGVAGLVGFLAQMVAGMQGRLVPLYAWYRAYDGNDKPPAVSAHALASPAFAQAIFSSWAVAVPLLAYGLASSGQLTIRVGALLLMSGVGLGIAYITRTMWRCERTGAVTGPTIAARSLDSTT